MAICELIVSIIKGLFVVVMIPCIVVRVLMITRFINLLVFDTSKVVNSYQAAVPAPQWRLLCMCLFVNHLLDDRAYQAAVVTCPALIQSLLSVAPATIKPSQYQHRRYPGL